MKSILSRLGDAFEHLKIIDEFLLSNPTYGRIEGKLEGDLKTSYLEFCKEVYYGGSREERFDGGSRQMALSDVFQYLVSSRGFYLASENESNRKDFIKITMYLIDQWLLMDSLGPKEELQKRRELMDKLKDKIGNFHEGDFPDYHKKKFEKLYNYEGDIIPGPPNTAPPDGRILDQYDSLFPKIRGGPIELLVYLYLMQRRLGFTVSLLMQQRLFSGQIWRAPPDLLLLRSKGEVIGLEIGRGKEKQSADFGLLTAIPTFSVDLVERQPFRCEGCGKWIIYCDRVIEVYSENGVPADNNPTLTCVDCPYFQGGQCSDIIYFGEGANRYGAQKGVRRFHFQCLNEGERSKVLNSPDLTRKSLVAYLPLVEGLEELPEEYKSL